MTDWYVSSIAYAAVSQWVASHAYATGAIVRQLSAPAVNRERCFRVTAGGGGNSGTTEPAWNTGDSQTTTDGALTWTECTGQSTHQHDNSITNTWTAPAARVNCLLSTSNGKNAVADGDRIFVSSDHAETQASTLGFPASFNMIECISVNRTTGNIPPLPADIAAGASLTTTGANIITLDLRARWTGFTFVSGSDFYFGNAGNTIVYLKNCTVSHSGNMLVQQQTEVTWENITYQVTAVGNQIRLSAGFLNWVGGIVSGATLPTTLFNAVSGANHVIATVKGVDLSNLGSGKTLVLWATPVNNSNAPQVYSFRNCKLGASVTPSSAVDEAASAVNLVELVNCDSNNTNYNNSWYRFPGIVTTETTITRSGGASDGTQAISRKMLTNANVNVNQRPIRPLVHHIWQWNTLTGSSKTATVEFVSSGSLNNNDIDGQLEYLADGADNLSAFVNCGLPNPLTTASAQPTSTATWAASPTTPIYQKLNVTFTPQKAGLMHFIVRLYKASTTVYVDPLITLS